MRIDLLKARNFRNIENSEIVPGPHLNLFLGDNAQGKTSLLESIYFLCQLKSFRTKNLAEIVSMGKSETQIEAGFSTSPQKRNEVKIRFGLDQKKIILDQKIVTRDKYFGKMKSVVFSPESLSVIKGGPEERRDLIDDAAALVFEEAAKTQRHYLKILKQRNAWLRQIKNQEIDLKKGRDLVESLHAQFVNSSADLLFLRQKLIQEIREPLKVTLSDILGQDADITIRNFSRNQPWERVSWAGIKERLEHELLCSEKKLVEEKIGRSMSGPHLHEISFIFSGHEARNYCSQGQQRAVILAFKISEIVYHRNTLGAYPILLLDDVLSEFDKNKRKYLVNFLNKNEAQTFLTATEHDALGGAEIFNVENGKALKA